MIAYPNLLYHPPCTTLHHTDVVDSNLALGSKHWVIYEHIWGEVQGEAGPHVVCQVRHIWYMYLPRLLQQLDGISIHVWTTLAPKIGWIFQVWLANTGLWTSPCYGKDTARTCPGHWVIWGYLFYDVDTALGQLWASSRYCPTELILLLKCQFPQMIKQS